ncbi:MAG: hypothetical protein ACKO9G_01990, partial [Dolichospermum sp.]
MATFACRGRNAKKTRLSDQVLTITNNDNEFQTFLRTLNQNFYHQTIYSRQLEKFCSDFFKKDFSKYFDHMLSLKELII